MKPITFSFTYRRSSKPLTLVLIHGLGGSKEYLQSILNRTDLQDFNILIPDLVGFGDTPAPQGFTYTMQEQADSIRNLIDELNIRGDIAIIAHSMGGPVGVILAEALGDRAKAVVYAEGNIDFDDCFSSNLVITRYTFEEYKAKGFAKGLDILRKQGNVGRMASSQEKAGAETIYLSSKDLVKVSSEDTLVGRLSALKIPVLAIYGEMNRGKWTSEKKLAALFPLVFIPEAGHLMMVDNPDAFYNEVAAFINKM
ncbi:MAG: alpha/beta hydrolase [Candidatus Bathyarchaeota archaeon]|nr:alpha/beta hydrolase [Candidatus Bathyarchaeota archaeon]